MAMAFKNWEIVPGVEFVEGGLNSASAKFIMPNGNVTATAVFEDDEPTGSFVDERDGREYATVKIGTQVWMAENLDYAGNGGVYYGNAVSPPFERAGRLYTIAQAIEAANAVDGWHLPTLDEIKLLVASVGGNSIAGLHLKTTKGWKNTLDGTDGNGLDTYGFSALPAGVFNGSGFTALNSQTWLWTITTYRFQISNQPSTSTPASATGQKCYVRLVKD
jgi:uncharacterized protein (TIGR02145 family)